MVTEIKFECIGWVVREQANQCRVVRSNKTRRPLTEA